MDDLWTKDRIFTVVIVHARFQRIRVSLHVCTSAGEVDRFADALEKVARNGLPA